MVTIEVAGRAIAVTDASAEQARALFDDEDFRLGLLTIASSGEPLWDTARPFTVRPAADEEVAAFDASLDESATDDGINVLFLVPLDTAENRTLH
jgi:hypothetical protein